MATVILSPAALCGIQDPYGERHKGELGPVLGWAWLAGHQEEEAYTDGTEDECLCFKWILLSSTVEC